MFNNMIASQTLMKYLVTCPVGLGISCRSASTAHYANGQRLLVKAATARLRRKRRTTLSSTHGNEILDLQGQ
jgi:hypothetical protein